MLPLERIEQVSDALSNQHQIVVRRAGNEYLHFIECTRVDQQQIVNGQNSSQQIAKRIVEQWEDAEWPIYGYQTGIVQSC